MSGPDGLALVDKPGGITSHDAIDRVRAALGTRKVGHAGTLDPMATGLLLVGVGAATRLLRFLGDLGKVYEGTVRLGDETDTLDAEGAVTATRPVDVTRAEVDAAAARLVGPRDQAPPAYSAVKVGGTKLYEAARRGETLAAAPRPIVVHAFEVTSFDGADVGFRATVSSGTYVRVLAADLGADLGCGAHLARLVRTAIGPFRLEDAAPPSAPRLLPPSAAVAHLPRVELDGDEARAAAHGSILAPAGLDGPYAVVRPDGSLIGIWRDDRAKARPEVVLPVA
ncbi:MAG: tRNA pseudouridine(55) synthase TruB [Actinomycetota bacterium]